MLYIVGGCSRSGKSILADRIRLRHGVPWFPLDALKMGLHAGAASLGVHPDQPDLETGDRMWPIIEGLLDHLLFDGRDYLVEGVNLRPETIATYIGATDEPVRACFLGYPDADLQEKAERLAEQTAPPHDWLHRTGPENVLMYLAVSRTFSSHIRDACLRSNIPFVDTGFDFEEGLRRAESALIDGVDGRQPPTARIQDVR